MEKMPEKIGNFLLLGKLGEGAMGVVYEAKMLGKVVALKVISPSIAKNREFQERFLREMAVVSVMHHPNIVEAIDFGVDIEKDMYFVALEFIEGDSLADRLEKRGRIPLPAALEITRKVARGLEYAHEKKIIHRDIKPDNILISKEGEIKINDFGLVKDYGKADLTQPGAIVGTPLYMAPEQVMGEGPVDIRCDIYSLGITLYHMLAGRPPFIYDSPIRVINAHASEELPPLEEYNPGVPPSVAYLVSKMTQKKAAHRFEDPAELLRALDKVQRELEELSSGQGASSQDSSGGAPHQLRKSKLISHEVYNFGQKLIELGAVSEEQITNIFQIETINSKKELLQLLFNYGILTEEELAEILARKKNLEVLELDEMDISESVANIISPEIATQYGCIPVKKEGERLILALERPLSPEDQKALESMAGMEIKTALATRSSIIRAQAKFSKFVCSHCHEKLQVDWQFCPYCGTSRNAEPPEEQININPKILLAEKEDQSDINRQTLERIYPQGTILTTHSGNEIVELARKEDPDIVIMDVKMPGLSGMMATVSLRNDPQTCHIPIMLMATEVDEGLKNKAYMAGADEFLSQPINYQEVKVKMERILRSSSVPLSEQNIDDMLTASKVMIGKLDMMNIPELIQTMVRSGKSGTLILTREEEKGELHFKNGKIIEAQIDEKDGEDAFFEILGWDYGKFRFRQGDPEVEERIKTDTMGLLMEGCRLLDEEGK